MVKCILKGMSSDPITGEESSFQTQYNGIPAACSMWASGYKHGFLSDCSLFYEDSELEVPDAITDRFYDRYYYGRYIFDENGEEIGKKSWKFLHINLYFPFGTESPEICPNKTGVLIKTKMR